MQENIQLRFNSVFAAIGNAVLETTLGRDAGRQPNKLVMGTGKIYCRLQWIHYDGDESENVKLTVVGVAAVVGVVVAIVVVVVE